MIKKNQQPVPRRYNPLRRTFECVCKVCGRTYLSNNRHSIYCSVTCQQRKWRKDKEIELVAHNNYVSEMKKNLRSRNLELLDANHKLYVAKKKLKLTDDSELSNSVETGLEKELKEAQNQLARLEKERDSAREELRIARRKLKLKDNDYLFDSTVTPLEKELEDAKLCIAVNKYWL